MHGDEHDLCSGAPHLGDRLAYGRDDVADHQPALQVVAVPHHRARRRGAHDADFYALTLHDRPRPESAFAVGAIRIRRKKRERRLGDRALQKGHAVVELVIAHCRGVVVHGIHRGHDRMRRAARRHPRRHVREGIALEEVAGIEQDYSSGSRGAHGVHDGGGTRQASAEVLAIGLVVPAADSPVNVRRGRDDEVV